MAIRARRTIGLLRQSVASYIVPAEVLDLSSNGTGVQVRTAEGTWVCDEALITAGIDTPGLAAHVGVQVPMTLIRHARLTFVPRRSQGDGALACWIDQSGAYGDDLSAYAVSVGATGRYAVGVSAGGRDFPGSLDVEEVSRRSAALARRYVPVALPGLDPVPVDEVRCAYNAVGLPEGDGFHVERRDAVTVLWQQPLQVRARARRAAEPGRASRRGPSRSIRPRHRPRRTVSQWVTPPHPLRMGVARQTVQSVRRALSARSGR